MADLTALALNAAATLSVWELHGLVCGLAIGPDERFPMQELADLVGVEALTDHSSVEEFVNAAVAALRAEDLSFNPLLPEDDAPLALRVQAVAEFTAGFLAGFGVLAARLDWQALPDGAQEVIDDLTAVTELDVDAVDGQDLERAESDLLQVQEFVKVAVLLLMGLADGDLE